jgi:uncharacterized membrane protein
MEDGMQGKSVGVGEAVSWIGCGWGIFTKNAGIWIVLGLITLVGIIVLSFIPFVGSLALSLIMPVISAGLLYGASQLEQGKTLEVGHLFEGFKQSDKTGSLIAIGGINLGASIVMMIIMFMMIGGSFMMGAALGGGSRGGAGAGIGFGLVMAVILVLLLQILVAMALFYAVPLIMFKGARVGEAIKASFGACVTNFIPLLVFALIFALIAIAASIPFFLGWIVLLPMSYGIYYCSYRSVFE